jgi:hypothetical protein
MIDGNSINRGSNMFNLPLLLSIQAAQSHSFRFLIVRRPPILQRVLQAIRMSVSRGLSANITVPRSAILVSMQVGGK